MRPRPCSRSTNGQPVGSFGAIASYSTYAAHPISTGTGGLCTTNDAGLLEIMKSLINHGRDPVYTRIDDDAGKEGPELDRIVKGRFSFTRLGHSFRSGELEAAVGLGQLGEWKSDWNRREAIVDALHRGLAPLTRHLCLPRARPGAEHGYMFYAITILDPGCERADLLGFLERRAVETRELLPLINQPVYRRMFGNLDAEYPVAASLNERAFYIGCHSDMTDEDVAHTVSCFLEYFGTS